MMREHETSACRRDFTSAEAALRLVLTDRAAHGLSLLGARFDPSGRRSGSELSSLLRRWGLPAHPAALDFEAQVGGLFFADLRWGPSMVIGAWPGLPDEAQPMDESAEVLIGESTIDNVKYSVDAAGTVLFDDDTIETTKVAASWIMLFERLGAAAVDAREHPLSLRVRARVGLEIAESLGAALVDAATDDYAASWHRPGSSVLDEASGPYDGEPRTTVTTASLDDLVRAMQIAAARGAPMSVFGVPHDPTLPPGTEPPTLRVPFWGPVWEEGKRKIRVYGGPGKYRFVWGDAAEKKT